MDQPAQLHRFEHHAMATKWELVIACEDRAHVGAAAHEAFQLVDRLEDDFSRFRPTSYISQLARLKRGECLKVNQETFDCLALATAVYLETRGAFDINLPDPDQRTEFEDATSLMDQWTLEESSRCIHVHADHIPFDLGGIGKGFALDEVVHLLHEWEIENALLHSGQSTIFAIGQSPGEDAWPVTLGSETEVFALKNQALSASGFEVQGAHILDPLTRAPLITSRQRTWVFADSAALADALSTALMVMNEMEIEAFMKRHPEITLMIL